MTAPASIVPLPFQFLLSPVEYVRQFISLLFQQTDKLPFSLCSLCVLCASVVNPATRIPQGLFCENRDCSARWIAIGTGVDMTTRMLVLACILLIGGASGKLASTCFASIGSMDEEESALSGPAPALQRVERTSQHFDPGTLAERLRQTNAIGFFTKLQLKGDIENLVKEVDDHYAGKNNATLMQLHERFQLLFHKIVTLVQNKDPQLAKDITSARQSLWEWVSDPNKSVKL